MKRFSVLKSRKTLLKCDIAQIIISTAALTNGVIAAQMIVIPRVVTILYGIAVISSILIIKAAINIKDYYKKKDELYMHM